MRCCALGFSFSEDVATLAKNAGVSCSGPDTSDPGNIDEIKIRQVVENNGGLAIPDQIWSTLSAAAKMSLV